jgi:hypothetical protein
MLDLPHLPVLDKLGLVGGCARLGVPADAARLRAEVEALPPELWHGTAGRVRAQQATEAIFLRGHAPAEGDRPVEDRPPLAQLPYARHLIYDMLGASPLRCLLARMPPGHLIPAHVDRAPYFSKTLRVHVPIVSSDQVLMYSNGLVYRMRPGEIWVLNNSSMHGVWNASVDVARVHMICDFAPTPALLAHLAKGDRGLGVIDEAANARFAAAPQA